MATSGTMMHRLASDMTTHRWVFLAAALLLCVFAFTRHRLGTNVLSRFVTVERLVETGSLSHDGSPLPRSIDVVMIRGKIYSSKPPLYSLMLATQAGLMRWVTGLNVYLHQRFYLSMLVLVQQVFPFLLALALLLRILRQRIEDEGLLVLATVGLTLASLAFGYAVTLNNHTPATYFLIYAFWLAYAYGGLQAKTWAIALSGVCVGMAASMELTAAAFTATFGLWWWYRSGWRSAWFGVGASVPIGATLGLYAWLSGSAVPFYLQRHLYDFPGSYWRNPTGPDALNDPTLLYLFHGLFGHHGFFSLTPFLFLGAMGFWFTWKRRTDALAQGLLAALAGSVVIMTYILFKTNNYGGTALGMRWFSQSAPFWVVAAVYGLQYSEWHMKRRGLVVALTAISCIATIEVLAHSLFYAGGWPIGLWKALKMVGGA